MAMSNKQQLDELLGIMDELSKQKESGNQPAPQNQPPQQNQPTPQAAAPQPPSQPQQPLIPDDLPDSGTAAVQTAPPVSQTAIQQAMSPELNLIEKDDKELVQTQKNLQEIDDLIAVSKNVMQHVYGVVTSTDILDAATISAAAKLISETRALIAEHLTIQKDERDFLNKVQMEAIKHRHQMELMEKRYELEKMRFQQKNPAMNAPANNIQPQPVANGMKSYSSADLMKMVTEGD